MTLAEDIKRIRATLWGKVPFISSLLGRARIVETESVPTAGVDKRSWVYINISYWEKLDLLCKTWLIAHEVAGHAAFLHPLREGSRVPNPEKQPSEHMTWNISADCAVNVMLEEFIRAPEMERFAVTAETIARLTGERVDDIKKMSVEEIYDLLQRNAVKVEIELDLIPSCLGEGETVQEGDSAFGGDKSPAEIKEAWRGFVARAYIAQKTAGTVPAGLERIVNEFIRPSLDPRALLRQGIRAGLGKLMISDWRRPSRRYPDLLPWTRQLRIPTIWALTDASGSIGGDELKLFLGTVYEFAKHADVKVISFDTRAYELVTARRPAEVIPKVARHIRGGGGTEIRNALEQTLARMKNRDIVLVLTDMCIFDLDQPGVQHLLTAVSGRSSACAFCTTGRETLVKGWRVIRLKS